MSAETVHAFALVSLRALADHDPHEFARTTDLSRRDVDTRIEELLLRIGDQAEVTELRRQLGEMRSLVGNAENHVALQFLLRQVSLSAQQHAQTLAIQVAKTPEWVERPARPVAEHSLASTMVDRPERNEEQFLRLSVMRLLRDLSEYQPVFHLRWKGELIDCVLEPLSDEQPPVLVEFKTRLSSGPSWDKAIRRFHRVGSGWGRDALFAVIVGDVSAESLHQFRKAISDRVLKRTFFLSYDIERNEFVGQSHGPLVQAVQAR